MAEQVWAVRDEVWEAVEPLLPPRAPQTTGRPCCGASTAPGKSTGPPRWSTAAKSALFKGALTGPSPVDRGRTGSKHHLIVDAHGIPLAATLTGGNRNDVTQLLPLVDGVGPVRGKPGRPRQRAETLIADRGYDHDQYRRELWRRGSSRSSPAARPNTAPASAGCAGLSSAPSPGCITSAGCAPATSAAPNCTRRSSTSAGRSSASASCARSETAS
jgi:transposase